MLPTYAFGIDSYTDPTWLDNLQNAPMWNAKLSQIQTKNAHFTYIGLCLHLGLNTK